MTDKKKKTLLRNSFEVFIRTLFFLTMPAAFSSGFLGVKLIFNAIGAGEPINIDRIWVLAGLLVFTIIFGRFFCGFVCAFGTLGDLVYFISGVVQKKLFKRKKQIAIPEKASAVLQKLKYIILFAVVMLCLFGIYSKLSGISPWDVFSRFMILKLPTSDYIIGIILFALIIIGMAFKKRFFCRFLCPMGAIFSLLPVLPFSRIHRDESNCIKGCQACKMNCPVHIKPGEDILGEGECISCEKCMNICPKKNLTRPERRIIKNDIVLLLVKAAIFFVMGIFLGLFRFI